MAHGSPQVVSARWQHGLFSTLALKAAALISPEGSCTVEALGEKHSDEKLVLHWQVVVRVRPMFDVEAARGEQYAVQTNPDDPRHVQVDITAGC